jgi:hypothetical protein
MDLLDTTNRIVYTNSQTAELLATRGEVKKQAGGWTGQVLGLSKILNVPNWTDTLQKMRMPAYADALTQTLADPSTTGLIKRIKRLPNGTERAVQTMGLIGAIHAGETYQRPKEWNAPVE